MRQEGILPFGIFSEINETKSEINSEQTMGSENREINTDDETINAEKINSSILASKRTSVVQISNDSIFPQLSYTSTLSKSSAIPPESELIATPIFDSVKLINSILQKLFTRYQAKMTRLFGL